MKGCLSFSGRVLMKNILTNITKSGDPQEINNIGSLFKENHSLIQSQYYRILL